MIRIVFGALLFLLPQTFFAQTFSDSVFNFINANKKNFAITLIKNKKLALGYKQEETVPLATMSDLLVAIEFAKQSTYTVLDSAEKISLKDIVTFHLENKYQPEYEDWLTYLLMQKIIKDQNTEVSLAEVANGILRFGVQPNTEYLIDRVGYDNVKSSIMSYNMANHTTIAAPMGSLALYQNRKGANEKKMFKAISDMEDDAYAAASYLMHSAIKGDSTFKNKIPSDFPSEKVMQVWANNLPQGTVKSYANLLLSILNEKTLDAKFYKTLRKVLEYRMQETAIKDNYDRYMEKTSSTVNCFSQAKFSSTKDKNELILVYSMYGLSGSDVVKMKKWQPRLEELLEKDENFVKKLGGALVEKTKK